MKLDPTGRSTAHQKGFEGTVTANSSKVIGAQKRLIGVVNLPVEGHYYAR